jgi:RNA polymerase sigma-70 factor (ECF subfamily)
MATLPRDSESVELMRAVEGQEGPGIPDLLDRHRERLRRMVACRMDRRLASRLDPSDVVQETFIHARQKLPAYLREPRLPIYPWLRSIAWERLIQLRRHHVRCSKRAVDREQPSGPPLPQASPVRPIDSLVASGTSPSGRLMREEARAALMAALDRMSAQDREVLALRYLEQRPLEDVAVALGLGLSAVKMRHLRALQRLREMMPDGAGEPGR